MPETADRLAATTYLALPGNKLRNAEIMLAGLQCVPNCRHTEKASDFDDVI